MRINTNVSALNAWRNLAITDNALTKSLERLSSGLRINRAADDAAGLAISEKMRGQIRGLNQAVRNAQDGISLIQTAEGALNETQAILQRMRELAVQASNDTLTLEDRYQIQKEINQLTEEVQRIGTFTEFNTQRLLDGNFKDKKFHIGANQDQTLTVKFEDMRAITIDSAGTIRDGGLKIASGAAASYATTIAGQLVTVNAISLVYINSAGNVATVKAYAQNVVLQTAAEAAITVYEKALNAVSSERAKLGAYQNRLEHTINNLSVAAENLAASESRIRDADMALEMVQFVRNQILLQSGTAMLAQANVKPQAVLQLLA